VVAAARSEREPSPIDRPPAQQLVPVETLRSMQMQEAAWAQASPLPPIQATDAASAAGLLSRGAEAAPSVSIVAPAPPAPWKIGIDKNTLIALLIGVVFLLLGIGITLGIALRRPATVPVDVASAPSPASVDVPAPPADDSAILNGPKAPPAVKKPTAPAIGPLLPRGAQPPKSKGKGH
jgi:hypothetical protein